MPTTRETIPRALHALLQTKPAPVLRSEILPGRVLAAGLLILRDGDPDEPAVTLASLHSTISTVPRSRRSSIPALAGTRLSRRSRRRLTWP